MNPSPEESDQLRELLALKRYEQPPPGFFNHFSDKVIARIEAEGLVRRISWWERLFPELDAKPVLACAYGLVISGLLVVALGISESLDPEESTTPPPGSPWFAQTPAPAAALPADTAVVRPLTHPNDPTSSVNPVFTSSAPRFLFDVNRMNADSQQISYNLP